MSFNHLKKSTLVFVVSVYLCLKYPKREQRENIAILQIRKTYAIKIVCTIYSCRYKAAIYREIRNNSSDCAIAIVACILVERRFQIILIT